MALPLLLGSNLRQFYITYIAIFTAIANLRVFPNC